MDEFIERSPFRKFFKHIWCPTVDSPGQLEEWIQSYENNNLTLCYSDFGIHTLMSTSPKIKVWKKPMRVGLDLNIFKPGDRAERKKDWLGCRDDVRVVIFSSRNQSRKLFPDAIDAFARMKNKYAGLDKSPADRTREENIIFKSVLLLHTSWPDNMYSYDYPRHVARLQTNYHGLEPNTAYKGIKNDVMNTYLCHACGHTFASWAINLYQKPIQNKGMGHKIYIPCQKCGREEATTPDTANGFTLNQLASFYQCGDLGIQVAIAEGESCTPNEMKACGVPVLVMDHSALAEKGRFPAEYKHIKEQGITEEQYTTHLGGETIKVARHYYEPETSQRRCLPDIDDLADKMYKYLIDDELRERKGREARKCAEDNYDWDKIAKEWEYILDNVKPLDRSTTWDRPYERIQQEVIQLPQNLLMPGNEEQFVDWLYINVLKYERPDNQNKATWVNLLRQGQRNHAQVIEFFRQVRAKERAGEDTISRYLAPKDANRLGVLI